jgi:hypothetical protein
MKTNGKPQSSRSSAQDFIQFRLMLGTRLVKPIWIVGAIWICLGSVALIHRSVEEGGPWGIWGVVLSFFFIVFGNMLWRIICEAFLAFFSMFSSVQESLHSIDRALKSSSVVRSDN